jgi:hypothetical protein
MSTYPQPYLATKHGLTDVHCGKAVCAGIGPFGSPCHDVFRIQLDIFRDKLRLLTDIEERKLAADLQPFLLGYRIRETARVRPCEFDAPVVDSEIRTLASVL